MNLYSLNTFVVVLVVLGLVVPTGATITADQLLDTPNVVLTPHDGPNGERYAELGSEGNLSIDLETVGVNPNALTSIRDVFDVNNHGKEAVRFWVTHGAADSVQFMVDGNGSIQGETNNVTLGSGETRAVSLLIDTQGVGPTGEPLLTAFQFHVAPVPEEPTTPTEPTPTQTTTSGTGGAVAPTPAPVPTPEPAPTPTTTAVPGERVEDVEVVRDEPADDEVRVREVPVEEVIEAETDEDDARPPRVVIEHAVGDRPVLDDERARAVGGRLRASGVNALVEVGQEVTLSGAKSVLGSVRSVDPERRLVKAVDIDVPEDDEDEPATIRMRVNAERFTGTGLTRPRIGRKTDEGWQMLPTRVGGEEGGQLILEARTPGFSRFAVFATPEVRYTWRLGNETVTTEELRTRFDEPGFHNVSLTVVDGLGRSSTATYRVLVNDRPEVSVEVPSNRTTGQPLLLRANVTDEVGNVTIGWTLPDGSQQSGLKARYTFPRGEHTVMVTAEDEYGARTTVEQTVAIGALAEAKLAVDRVAGSVSTELAIGLVALASFLLATLLRRVLSRRGFGLPRPSVPVLSVGPFPLRRRGPTIVAFDDPVVDVRNRRFRIGHLRIEDADRDLATVEIAVVDGRGNEVARKTVDLQGQAEYVVRNGDVMPKSRVYVRGDEEYTVRVRAGDRHDRWTGSARSRVRSPATSGTPG